MSDNKFRMFDLAFVVDTTGSMGSFINDAKKSMIKILKPISSNQNIDLAVGVVEYKDHCDAWVVKSRGITIDMAEAQRKINKLTVGGGGDTPEAVFDGLDELVKLKWRKYSKRVGVLVGDAPPHGYAARGSDSHPKGCPCGLTLEKVTSEMENKRIVLHAFPVDNDRDTLKSFELIAGYTGGKVFRDSGNTLKEIQTMIEKEFDEIVFDEKIYEAMIKLQEINKVVKKLESNRISIANSVGRLLSKGLLTYDQKKDKWM